MIPGVLTAPMRAVSAARPGGGPGPALGRPLLLAGLATLAPLAAGMLPARHSVPVAVTLNFLAVVLVLLVRGGPCSAHPSGWRWYAISVAVGGAGALAAGAVLPWGQTALGSVPGQLLVVVAVLHMLDRASVRAARARMASMLALFVVADLLTVHTAYRLTVADSGLSLADTVALFSLLGSVAMGTGFTLVLIAVSPPAQRAVGWLLFAAQVATALACAASSIATGPGLVQFVACAASALGVALQAVACRIDRPGAPCATAGADPGGSTLGALLPHCTALVGGALLLLSVPITGRLTIFGTTLGMLGLLSQLAHQAASWRTQQQLTRDLQRSEAWFRTLVRGSADPVLILDDQLRVQWVSPSITELLGVDPQTTIGLPVADAVHPDDAPGLLAALGADHGDEETRARTARVRHADGRWRLIQARVRDLRSDPDVGALVLYCRDVTGTAPQPVEPDLTAYSTTDPATGLPNRSALTSRLGAALRGASAHGTSLVVVGIDGLSDGDDAEVLRELTARFCRVLRGADWLARAGVCEFAVVVDGTIADAEVVAARLVAAVEPIVTTGRTTARLTAAAGVAQLLPDGDAGDALRSGDLALRSARAAGRGQVRRHSDALRMTQDRAEALRADLAEALRANCLHLVYQPVVDLALHRTTSVEALLRWRHPVYGDVSPAEFIPLAEESALITDIGRWVLLEATATVAALPHPDLAVAVNVSARHVRSGDLVDDVLAALEGSGLPAARLILEITESVLLDDAHVVADLELLRRLGVRIAVDDFGTGWSSLAYLVGLPIDLLKMDRQFLADVETDPQRRALCSSVLHLGNSLGLAVVVEGVETPAELKLLRDMGHRYIQGFLMSRPVPAAALTGALDRPSDDVTAPLAHPVGARFPRTER